jgi:hypothetical protein
MDFFYFTLSAVWTLSSDQVKKLLHRLTVMPKGFRNVFVIRTLVELYWNQIFSKLIQGPCHTRFWKAPAFKIQGTTISGLVYLWQGVTKRCRLYLGWPIAPSDMSPKKCGGRGGAGSQPMSKLCRWSPNKLWGSDFIFNLCSMVFIFSTCKRLGSNHKHI